MICTGVCEFIKTKHGQGYSHKKELSNYHKWWKCGKLGELCYFCYVPNYAVHLELIKLFSAKAISMPIHQTLVPPIFIIYGICICGGRELKEILMWDSNTSIPFLCLHTFQYSDHDHFSIVYWLDNCHDHISFTVPLVLVGSIPQFKTAWHLLALRLCCSSIAFVTSQLRRHHNSAELLHYRLLSTFYPTTSSVGAWNQMHSYIQYVDIFKIF